MRLKRQNRGYTAPELNMASMIDVVFLLLIFFMCTSSYAQPENDMVTQLPQAGAARASEFDPTIIQLESVDGRVSIRCDGQACPSFDQLLAALKARRALADVPVIVRGSSEVRFGDMVRALDACYQADLWRVAFSTQEGGP